MLFAGRRVHHHGGQDLQHVVLNHVAKGAGCVVEAPAVFNAKGFRHRDLDAVDILAVPQRLDRRICEPRVEDVLNRLLAQIVVDAEDRLLGKMLEQRPVERLRRLAIMAERLFHDEAGVHVETALSQRGANHAEQAGRNREIMHRPLRGSERLLERRESLGIVVVAIDIPHERREPRQSGGVGASVAFDALFCARPQLLDLPTGLGDADDGDIDPFVGDETQKRREDLLEREIAGSAEEHQGVGLSCLHLILSGVEVGEFGSARLCASALSFVLARRAFPHAE
jgi:hypothetical protein